MHQVIIFREKNNQKIKIYRFLLFVLEISSKFEQTNKNDILRMINSAAWCHKRLTRERKSIESVAKSISSSDT